MDPEKKELFTNIAKYTGLTLASPFIVAGGVLATGALATYFFLDRIAFKNWKTTTASVLLAGTVALGSEYGTPVRQWALDMYKTHINIEKEYLENENTKLKSTIVDTVTYLNNKMEFKVDSVGLQKDTEIRVLKEIYGNNFAEFKKKQEKTEEAIGRLKENDKLIVGNINYQSKKLEEIFGNMNDIKNNQEKAKNTDLENTINTGTVKGYNLPTTKKAILKELSRKTYISTGNFWTTIDKGETLGQIAREYYGDFHAYKQIAAFNEIDNPNEVEIGQPIMLPDNGLKNKRGLNKTNFPKNTLTLNKGDNLVNRLKHAYNFSWNEAKERANEIVAYNRKIGNEYATTGKVKHNKIIVSLN